MKKNVVLVHGFWADSSCYSAIIPLLQKEGYNVIAPQMALTSIADDVVAVKRAIDTLDGDCLLVGHSYGGVVITHAGNHPKVTGLLFIAAFAPDLGEKMLGLLQQYPATAAVVPFFDTQEGFVWMKKQGVREVFAQDLTTELADVLWAVQKTPNGAIFETPATEIAWKNKPNWFIISSDDKTIDPDLQRFEAKRMNATTTEVAASHVSMISKPVEVADFIKSAASQL